MFQWESQSTRYDGALTRQAESAAFIEQFARDFGMDTHSVDDLGMCSNWVASGNLLHSYWKWPIEIVDLPIKDGDFP